ncbi:hypothetical protein D3C80_1486280 [compost metagenome]
MPAVQPQFGVGRLRLFSIGSGGQTLHPRGPTHCLEPRRDGGFGQVQLQGGGHGHAGVVELMRPAQRRGRQVEEAFLILINQPAALGPGVEVHAHDGQRRMDLRRAAFDHGHNRLGLTGDDAARASFQDARLLGGDALDPVAQELGVVQIDGGDDAQQRPVDDVGGVQRTA